MIFTDARKALGWAKSDVQQLETAIRNYTAQSKARRVVEQDPETGNKIHKIVIDGQLSPDTERWVNQSFQHFRHSLDQAICAAWENAGLGAAPDRLTYPVTTNLNDLNGRLANDPILSKLTDAIKDAVRKIQPYPRARGVDGGNDAITALSKAAQKKHRIVCKVSGQVTNMTFSNGKISNISEPLQVPSWDMEKGEFVLGITHPTGEISGDFSFAFFITVQGAGMMDGAPLIHNLKVIERECSCAIAELEASIPS